ncbi:DUF3718 domain-containing protein [Colwellia demingiae]|uniref:DUF3718 domain-containing protein n=2 Tax=Colwellia demingiae TaxID=89401 RepID=A0A5C6QLG4_9GAMM|nr:DUF3718 domain-containing protein [Colwellia demingiae]
MVFSFINSIIKVYKMKKLLIASTITALTLTSVLTTPKAQAADIATSICEYVAADDKKRMRSFLKTNKLKIRRIFDNIQCNGKNLLEFASTSGSVKTGSLMISKLPKKVVSANLEILQTGSQPLIDAANARVSS